jgi:hypothetical protein
LHEPIDEIKNTFFSNFFSNTYNLIKGTELFGNFNQFMDEIMNFNSEEPEGGNPHE